MKNKKIVQRTLYAVSLYICSISANNSDVISTSNLRIALELSSQLPKLSITEIEAAQKIQRTYRQHKQKQLQEKLKLLSREEEEIRNRIMLDRAEEMMNIYNQEYDLYNPEE